MFNKLVKLGHVVQGPDGYVRTAAGDQAIADYDAALPEHSRQILRAIADGKNVDVAHKGFLSLIHAGLIRVSEGGARFLTSDAKALV